MAYAFEMDDPTHGAALRRVADKQLKKGVKEVGKSSLTLDRKVHQVRKRAKKVRGLVRLVRPGFDGYADVNARLRDAAKPLSPVRDAAVFIETFDRLKDFFSDHLSEDALTGIRARLTGERAAIPDAEVRHQLDQLGETLSVLRDEAKGWKIEGNEDEAIEEGLAKTYGRAVKAMNKAIETGTDDDLHEWRKRAKYHWYHMRLLAPLWPEAAAPRAEALDRLTDLLGDHHDLAVFADFVRGAEAGTQEAEELTRGLVLARQQTLEEEALALGRRLFSEKPKAFARRLAALRDAVPA